MRDAFKNAASKQPQKKKSFSKKLGDGTLAVIKMPWKLTKVVVLSLEKVKNFRSLTNIFKFRSVTDLKPLLTLFLDRSRQLKISLRFLLI